MALTNDSLRGVVRRKAQRAHEKVRVAEHELEAANETLKEAIPRRDVDAITEAAKRTLRAEGEVHQAAHDLEVVGELLYEPGANPPTEGASGQGAKALLPLLGRRPR